jgi:hypothetical protein
MPEWFQATTRLRALSFVLALLAWVYVRFLSANANLHAEAVSMSMPVTISGLRAGTSAKITPHEVTVVAPERLEAEMSIHARVDLDGRGPGTYHLPVAVEADGDISSLAPANITVTIEGAAP